MNLVWCCRCVGAESDQHVNIGSFAVRCDRMWPYTQWHRVYTGSGNVPYVQFKSVGDFIPEPRCSKFAVWLQTRRRKMGVQEVRSDTGLKGREWRELRYVLSVWTYARGLNLVVLLLCMSELRDLSVGRERILFYRWRGRPLQAREREVRMLSSLVAHAVEYKMTVGAHNTVVVRRMWEVLSPSSGMADVGACHIVDAQRHVGGFTMFAWYGKCRRPQHCW